ncbi:sterol desaturase family protein [Vogesella sp. GCM10023246]|uniref:Sterol desaturase family protein n=1 Tax=Vogesella oryzagri TaxID=3160864 RepID=A0ABV1M8D8_9NEIS
MKLFALEHGEAAYRVDFALYGVAIAGLLLFLLLSGNGSHRLDSTVLVMAGLLEWSALEYASHRFVLHGVAPFSRWHAEHHRRPAALIYTPTLLSGLLFAVLVFLPVWWLGDLRRASALTLGVLLGYVGYALTHHALHHLRRDHGTLYRLKCWHARHHRGSAPTVCYGVTSRFWDVLLLTDGTYYRGSRWRRLAGQLLAGLLLAAQLLLLYRPLD